MTNNLAPVAITVYDRPKHFQKCLHHLAKAKGAETTEVLIFIDAPKCENVELTQKTILEICRNQKGFKSIFTIMPNENLGASGNLQRLLKYMSEEYDYFIVIEDDIICSRNFLTFMNRGLHTFKNDDDIQSISAYNIPDFTSDDELYLSKYTNAWGLGYWSTKSLLPYLLYSHNPYTEIQEKSLKAKVKQYHPKLKKLLKQINVNNKLNDIQATFYNIKNDAYQLRPTKSLTQNIGFDGSGEHCGIDTRFTQNITSNTTSIDITKVNAYKLIHDQQFYNFFHPRRSFQQKIKTRLSKPWK